MTDKKLEEAATEHAQLFYYGANGEKVSAGTSAQKEASFLAGTKWAYENPKQEDGYIFKGYTVQLLDPFGKIYWQATMLPERKE